MSEHLGMINLWQLERLPKGFDFKYSVTRNDDKKHFNSLNDAIRFASAH